MIEDNEEEILCKHCKRPETYCACDELYERSREIRVIGD